MALTTVDHSALKVNQTGIVATVLVAFIGSYFYRPLLILIPLLAVVLLLGTFAPQLALFKQFYFKVLKPRGIVKRDRSRTDPSPTTSRRVWVESPRYLLCLPASPDSGGTCARAARRGAGVRQPGVRLLPWMPDLLPAGKAGLIRA